ncbi:peptidoglycan-binding protein [Bradyrhizobium xenonodulans]|uniref:Peptidoglycan-binding protein n=1 Tax=Bradyrhizobium xenonodulans TaxID=2736875 RepID=A0ABY7MKC8_9BRAD|nr:peptidoglycan-binding domain-containing protein [Bradyrhizobium xenonodulans]WBL78855.1 peptidoglycan-binding protein [Bradyrhizobium xenonodulans]
MARDTSGGGTADLEREKLNADVRLRERELGIREREQQSREAEIALKEQEFARSRWSSPLVLAVIGAAIAGVFNGGVAWWNSREQQQLEGDRAKRNLESEQQKDERNAALEARKAEAARILEMIKTNDQEAAANNLKFLVEAGLVSDQSGQLGRYLAKRKPGEGPVLPLAGSKELRFSPQLGMVSGTGVYRMGDTALEIASVQTYLLKAGFYKGLPDGSFGPLTDEGVRRYETENNLPVTGLIGPRLLELARATGQLRLPQNYKDLNSDDLVTRCLYLTMALDGTDFDRVAASVDDGLFLGAGGLAASTLLSRINQAEPRTIQDIAGSMAETLLTNIQKPRPEFILWARSISAGDGNSQLKDPWQDILVRILQTDVSKRVQMDMIQERFYSRAKKLHEELKFTSERSLCMLFDFLWQSGAVRKEMIEEYKRLNVEMGDIERLGSDVVEQGRISNFFNAVVKKQTGARFPELLLPRRLVFVFGKGTADHAGDINLASNFQIELKPLER